MDTLSQSEVGAAKCFVENGHVADAEELSALQSAVAKLLQIAFPPIPDAFEDAINAIDMTGLRRPTRFVSDHLDAA